MTKAWLSQRGFPFLERNISTDDEAKVNLMALGYRTTPVVTIGKDVIVGYSVMRLEAALEEHTV